MTFDGKFEIGATHAEAVIDNADKTAAARLNRDIDAGCTGIECVLDKLFHRRSRPLDHFTSGDAIDKDGIETANGHGCAPSPHLWGEGWGEGPGDQPNPLRARIIEKIRRSPQCPGPSP